MSEVTGMAMVLTQPNVTLKTSTGLQLPTTHQCTDTRDGNYTCTGSMNGEYSQFYTHYTPVHRYKRRKLHMHRIHEWWVLLSSTLTTHQCTDTRDGNYTCTGSMNGEYSQFYTHYTTRAQDPWMASTLSSIPTTHQCTDTRDGNYTCTGSMKGEYS